jgi:pantoate--beta-alanine ligase
MSVMVTQVTEVRQAVEEARKAGRSIGFVPTMGALHAGHVSLVQAARRETGFVAVSIFVNPLQFALGEDYGRYPRTLERDLEYCRQEKVDLVFVPPVEVIYPARFSTHVEVSHLGDALCGPSRPGHFRGVATVVLKLFQIVHPDRAYFGQKDAQQCRIIRQMVDDLAVPVEVRICPTVREPDGLALSSRNQYLTESQRRQAVVLHQALEEGKRLVEGGERSPQTVRKALLDRLATAHEGVVDYVEVVSAESLKPLPRLSGEVLLAVAVKFGGTRLIDNVVVRIP